MAGQINFDSSTTFKSDFDDDVQLFPLSASDQMDASRQAKLHVEAFQGMGRMVDMAYLVESQEAYQKVWGDLLYRYKTLALGEDTWPCDS